VKPLEAIQLQVRQTPATGRGVFAVNFIAAGTAVMKLEGQAFRTQDIPPDSFAMQIDEDWWLCSDGTALDDCVNHCCDPNTGFAKRDPVLYALRDIAPGEQVTWDYSTSISEPGWQLQCLCASPRCRRVVLPFQELSLEQQMRLRPITLHYLRERLRKG
jgi:hypothetical protein